MNHGKNGYPHIWITIEIKYIEICRTYITIYILLYGISKLVISITTLNMDTNISH